MPQSAELNVERHLQTLIMETNKEQRLLLLSTISTPKASFYNTLFDFSVLLTALSWMKSSKQMG